MKKEKQEYILVNLIAFGIIEATEHPNKDLNKIAKEVLEKVRNGKFKWK